MVKYTIVSEFEFYINSFSFPVLDEEKLKAIEKALAFSEVILLKKNEHSIAVKEELLNKSTGTGDAAALVKKTGRKRKLLQILDDDAPILKKKTKLAEDLVIPAKPEGFMIHSKPINNKKNRKDRVKPIRIENTSAGDFTVETLPKKSTSPFTVTTLKYNPPLKFTNFKDKAILNSNVKRETASQLLARKKIQKFLQK